MANYMVINVLMVLICFLIEDLHRPQWKINDKLTVINGDLKSPLTEKN